jgi:hypothetical protein
MHHGRGAEQLLSQAPALGAHDQVAVADRTRHSRRRAREHVEAVHVCVRGAHGLHCGPKGRADWYSVGLEEVGDLQARCGSTTSPCGYSLSRPIIAVMWSAVGQPCVASPVRTSKTSTSSRAVSPTGSSSVRSHQAEAGSDKHGPVRTVGAQSRQRVSSSVDSISFYNCIADLHHLPRHGKLTMDWLALAAFKPNLQPESSRYSEQSHW